MGCSELGAEVWCREGDLTALELGDEAIVNVADFSLSGRSMRNVRQMVNRVAKHGYVAEVRRVGDIPQPELDRSSGRRFLAGQPDRARLLDGPRPDRRRRRRDCVLATAPRTAWSGPCCSLSRGAPTACRWT
jgi:hypothetical protein